MALSAKLNERVVPDSPSSNKSKRGAFRIKTLRLERIIEEQWLNYKIKGQERPGYNIQREVGKAIVIDLLPVVAAAWVPRLFLFPCCSTF